MIKKSFSLLDQSTVPLLYKSLVRPHLEYANVMWGPFYKGDVMLVERVQRRTTKLVEGIKSLPYQHRLHHLKLPSLAHRRRRGDLILAHKIFSGKVKLDPQKIFGMTTKTLRGHPYRLRKKQITTTLSYNTFSNRIVQDWNRLPKEIVTAQNSQIFKSRIDEWFKDDMYLIP